MKKILVFGIALIGALLFFGCCCATTDGIPPKASSPAEMAALRQGQQYKVTYVSETTGLGQDITTYYVKPPNMRVDDSIGGMPPMSFYILGGKAYACMEDAPGIMACIDTSSSPETAGMEETVVSQINADPIEANQGQFTISQAASRTVLGITTTCFMASSNNGNAQTESCYSPQGVLLYRHTLSTLVDTGEPIESLKQATEYSTSVSDSDLVLPAEPQSAE